MQYTISRTRRNCYRELALSLAYGCAPTEIIYRICLRYILGFSDEIHIEKNNIRLCDTLQYAKDGTLEEKMIRLFRLRNS